MILVLEWHTKKRLVMLVDSKTYRVKKEIPIPHSPFDLIAKVSEKKLARATALVVVFGMKQFSTTRQVALLANLYAAIYKKSLFTLCVPEDSSWNEIKPSIQRLLQRKGVSVLVPQYTAAPNITKKKK